MTRPGVSIEKVDDHHLAAAYFSKRMGMAVKIFQGKRCCRFFRRERICYWSEGSET